MPLMHTVHMKRVVIIGDGDVEYRLVKEVQVLGATGYTCCDARGQGERGIRPRHAESGNTKIEIIATAEVARKILAHVATHYFEKYAMIAYLDEIEVLQGEKFVKANRTVES
jgi:nitrogen regulatory protein P-II 2